MRGSVFLSIFFIINCVLSDRSSDESHRNPENPKLRADLVLLRRIKRYISPWVDIDFLQSVTNELCNSLISGESFATLYGRFEAPWKLLPFVYTRINEASNITLNAAIDELSASEAFEGYAGLYAVDFVVNNFESFYRIVEPLERAIKSVRGRIRKTEACSRGIRSLAQGIAYRKVHKFIQGIEAYYNPAQCQAIYNSLAPEILNLELYEFASEKCTGTGPSLEHLIRVASEHNVSYEGAGVTDGDYSTPTTVFFEDDEISTSSSDNSDIVSVSVSIIQELNIEETLSTQTPPEYEDIVALDSVRRFADLLDDTTAESYSTLAPEATIISPIVTEYDPIPSEVLSSGGVDSDDEQEEDGGDADSEEILVVEFGDLGDSDNTTDVIQISTEKLNVLKRFLTWLGLL